MDKALHLGLFERGIYVPFQTSPKFPDPSWTVSWISSRGISQWSRVSRDRSYIAGRTLGHATVSAQQRPDALPAGAIHNAAHNYNTLLATTTHNRLTAVGPGLPG